MKRTPGQVMRRYIPHMRDACMTEWFGPHHDSSQVAVFEGHSSWILDAAFAPDGSHIVTCSSDRSVRIWDPSSRSCTQAFHDVHTDQVWGVAFDPNGNDALALERLCGAGWGRGIRRLGGEQPRCASAGDSLNARFVCVCVRCRRSLLHGERLQDDQAIRAQGVDRLTS